jgi:hypothetical protein
MFHDPSSFTRSRRSETHFPVPNLTSVGRVRSNGGTDHRWLSDLSPPGYRSRFTPISRSATASGLPG